LIFWISTLFLLDGATHYAETSVIDLDDCDFLKHSYSKINSSAPTCGQQSPNPDIQVQCAAQTSPQLFNISQGKSIESFNR